MLQRNPSIEFRDITRYPIDTLFVDYNKQPIRLLGSVRISISSNGWKVEDAHVLISETRTRNLPGLDLHEQLGVLTTQLRAEPVHLLENIFQDPVSEQWGSFFAQKYAHILSRLGRSNITKSTLTLNSVSYLVNLKDVKFRSISRIELRTKSDY